MKHISLTGSIIAALAIIGLALWFKDTEYENAWLYVFCAWLIIFAIIEAFAAIKKNKNKGQ